MKALVKIQDKQRKYVKNKGMHCLDKWVPLGQSVEIEIPKNNENFLDSKEFQHWFEVIDQEEIQEEIEYEDEDFVASDEHTIVELRAWAKEQGYECTHLNKADLIEGINEGTLNKK